jgi:DHA3 family macrolide efflux protein-like MFS transporter
MTTFLGLFGMGISILVMAQAPPTKIIWVVGAALTMGIMQPITNGPIGAIMQATVSPDMQARVFSLLGSLASGMAPIGLIIAGPISDRVGIQAWFYLGGTLCILIAIVGIFIPAVMNIEAKHQDETETEKNALPEPSLGD